MTIYFVLVVVEKFLGSILKQVRLSSDNISYAKLRRVFNSAIAGGGMTVIKDEKKEKEELDNEAINYWREMRDLAEEKLRKLGDGKGKTDYGN